MKKHFDFAWKEIETIYNKGLICSERHLQCEIFRLLKITLSDEYKVFVEPRLGGECELKGKIPDFIITKDELIIAIVELKYTPHTYVKYQKDVDILTSFYQMFKENEDISFPLLTNPTNGDWNYEHTFKVSKDLMLIYCAIAHPESYLFSNQKDIWNEESVSDRYLQYVGTMKNFRTP